MEDQKNIHYFKYDNPNAKFGIEPNEVLNLMKGKYIIIDLRTMDFMKDQDSIIKYYDTEEEAELECGINELENAWVMKLIYNHIEEL
jgi:hypothetical protein